MFAQFNIVDAIDIFVVAVLLYYCYKFMKESGTLNIFAGVLAFIGIWVLVTQVFNMRLMGAIMNKFINVGVIILVVLFQDEIRRVLVDMGSHKRWRVLLKPLFPKGREESDERPYIMPIVQACMSMAKSKTGALIVIQKEVSLASYEQSGDAINADVNPRLIENIFFKNSPLHDGAMIVVGNRITAAACILPVSHNHDIPKALGLRHRAALGVTQETDATVVIVSEETGNISLAKGGRFYLHLSGKDLEQMLAKW